jgi:hypothetical protein
MIWNVIPNEERLRLWKNLRNDLVDLSLEKQLTEIAKFCSTIPFGARTLDYYSSENWPSPWEILFYGSFCTSSISLLMYYTFILIPNESHIELILVEDIDGLFLLPFIENQFILNYELGKVSNYSDIKNNIKVLKVYTRDQIKTIT